MLNKLLYHITIFCSILFLILTFCTSNLYSQQISDNDDDTRFTEPLFKDLSTDFGAEVGEVELNIKPGYIKNEDNNLYQSSLELEYVLFKNFGLELELPILYAFPDTLNSHTGIGNFEIETQYTLVLKPNMGLAIGLGFEFPTGFKTYDLNSDAYEIEPSISYVYKTPINIFFHANFGADIDFGGQLEFEPTYNGAILYSIDDAYLGIEFNGFIDEENILLISPQAGIEISDLFIGAGIQIPTNKKAANMDFNILARIIYEFSLRE